MTSRRRDLLAALKWIEELAWSLDHAVKAAFDDEVNQQPLGVKWSRQSDRAREAVTRMRNREHARPRGRGD